MSRENVEALRAVFEAGGAQDVEALMPFLPEDVVWYPPPGWMEAYEYHGHAGAREVLAIFTDNLDDYAVELVSLHDAGDTVVSLMWQTGRPKGSSQTARQRSRASTGTSGPVV